MGYIDKTLIAGEVVQYRSRLHWVVLTRSFSIGLVFLLLAVASALASSKLADDTSAPGIFRVVGIAFLCIAIAVVGWGIIQRRATEIAVTNKRVLIKTGLIGRRTVEVLLTKIESIGVDESVMGRVLGFGTVTVHGTGGTPEAFDKIAHPLEFRRQVQARIDGLRESGRVASQP